MVCFWHSTRETAKLESRQPSRDWNGLGVTDRCPAKESAVCVRIPLMHELLALLFLLPVDRVPIILVGLGYRLLAFAPAVILGCLCLRFCLGFDRGLVFRFDHSLDRKS